MGNFHAVFSVSENCLPKFFRFENFSELCSELTRQQCCAPHRRNLTANFAFDVNHVGYKRRLENREQVRRNFCLFKKTYQLSNKENLKAAVRGVCMGCQFTLNGEQTLSLLRISNLNPNFYFSVPKPRCRCSPSLPFLQPVIHFATINWK